MSGTGSPDGEREATRERQSFLWIPQRPVVRLKSVPA